MPIEPGQPGEVVGEIGQSDFDAGAYDADGAHEEAEPVHLQPYMRERYGFREGLCPVSEDVSSRSLALPFFTGIDPAAQERVAEVLASAL